MFNIIFEKTRNHCDGLTRRQALRLGTCGLFGGLTLPALLQLQAQAQTPASSPARAKACIFFMLEGGPSHIDMWDPKPDAPREIRGEFQTIATRVPGTRITEILPRCAQITNKFAILRSHSHRDNGHETGRHWVLTGYPPNFGDGQARGVPFNELYPSIGSIIARELGRTGSVPPYIEMPNPLGPGGPGFYGPSYAPFTVDNDPVQPDFEVRDLNVPNEINDRRFNRRRQLLNRAEALRTQQTLTGPARTMGTYYEQAMNLVTSPQAQRAFRIQLEPQSLRERYGYTSIGQCALLARRLVEAGCRFIGIDHGSWDTHVDNFTSHRRALVPPTDQALSALIGDLEDRGMLQDTLIVMMGEMGRTPRTNNDAGRDHWSQCQSVIFAGGGTRPGIVVGASDRTASAPTTTPYGIQDILQTILHLMGVDASKTYYTPLGRPVPIVNGGAPIRELIA